MNTCSRMQQSQTLYRTQTQRQTPPLPLVCLCVIQGKEGCTDQDRPRLVGCVYGCALSSVVVTLSLECKVACTAHTLHPVAMRVCIYVIRVHARVAGVYVIYVRCVIYVTDQHPSLDHTHMQASNSCLKLTSHAFMYTEY